MLLFAWNYIFQLSFSPIESLESIEAPDTSKAGESKKLKDILKERQKSIENIRKKRQSGKDQSDDDEIDQNGNVDDNDGVIPVNGHDVDDLEEEIE